MKRLHILIIVLLLVSFALGVVVGYRSGRHPAPSAVSGSSAPREMAGCVDFREAGAHTGETGCVAGRVLRVYTSRAGNTYLDFCPDYRNCPFSSVIFSSDRAKFGDLESLTGKNIELRGVIGTYQGRAEMILRDAQQIRAAP